MDPLSITVSIVALIGAAQQVAVGLNKLASLRGAPAAVLALNNELSDLRLVLSEAEPLLLKHGRAAAASQTATSTIANDTRLKLSIERAKDKLMELESIIQNRLMTRLYVHFGVILPRFVPILESQDMVCGANICSYS